jgi:hypothetical protein
MIYQLDENLNLRRRRFVGWKVVLGVSLMLNIVLGIGFIAYTQNVIEVPTVVHVKDGEIIEQDVSLNESSITEFLAHSGCVLPAVAVAQAKIESANYTSAIARENKNLFGIKFHKCKYVKGEHRGHASYDSYRNNILCYMHIQNHYLKNIDGVYAAPGPYVTMIKNYK